MSDLKAILESINEEAYRPADNVNNGDLAPVALTADDFQEETPLPVAPYPAESTPVSVEDIDEADFARSNPAVDAGYMVDPVVDGLVEEAILNGVREGNGVVELNGSHNEASDADANQKYIDKLLSKNPDGKVMRVGDKGFVFVDKDGNTAQILTKGGKHNARYSPIDTVGQNVIEKGHASDILAGSKLYEANEEDTKAVLEFVMGQLVKDAVFESKAKDEITGLFGLNEEEGAKGADLFEAAVNVAAKKHLTMLNGAAERYIAESLEAYHQTTQKQINEYLEFVVNEWVEENRVALEMGARTQIAESFMDNLKGLLESHYVEIPEGKTDLYEQSLKTGQGVLNQLNEALEREKELTAKINSFTKKAIVESALDGLVSTKAERVRELAEAVEFVNEAHYKSRVDFIVESVSGKAAPAVTKPLLEDKPASVEPVAISEAVDPEISAYLDFLARK